jgi:transposase-like protein
MPYPAATASCLTTSYCSKPRQKGGTLLAEDVLTLDVHRRRLADPDLYRPSCCPTCKNDVMHAHGFRGRRLRGDPDSPCEDIRRYRCRACGAIWQVLPACIARCLHRRWCVVQSGLVQAEQLEPEGQEIRVRIPAGTLKRWMGRIRSSASALVHVLACAGREIAAALQGLIVACSRVELLDLLSGKGLIPCRDKLACLSCLIHRLAPGIRVL